MPGTVLVPGNKIGNKTEKVSALMELTIIYWVTDMNEHACKKQVVVM